MINRFITRKQLTEITITPEQATLLKCVAGCGRDANPKNAVPTGLLGIGKITIYLCNDCLQEMVKERAAYSTKRKEQRKEVTH